MQKRISHITVIVSVIFVAAAALALVAALHRSTLVEWWRPMAYCLLPAAVCGIMARNLIGRFCCISNGVVNVLIGGLLSMPFILAAFYSLNYFNTNQCSATACKAEIVGKRSEQRYRSRRVGRGRYVRGDSYMEYFVDIKLPDGTTQSRRVTTGEYVGLRAGEHAVLHIEDGLFGFKVIKQYDLPAVSRKPRRKNRNIQ